MVNRCRVRRVTLGFSPIMTNSSTESTSFRAFVRLAGPFAMLLITTALAFGLSAQRRSVQLGERISPDGWSLSFQPLADWSIEFIDAQPLGEVVRMVSPNAEEIRRVRTILLHRINSRPGMSASDFAAEQLGIATNAGQVINSIFSKQASHDESEIAFGSVGRGVLIRDASQSLIIATCVVESGAYSLRLDSNAPLNERDDAIVASILASIEPLK